MPRPSRHRGKQVHRRGLSRERIYVMTGVNDLNETFLEVTGRGTLSRERAMDALRGRIAAGSVVATDRAAAYVGVLAELEVAAHAAYDPMGRSGGTINRINTVHSLLGAFMEPFRGVSTKHLGAYLAWFRWCRTFMAAGPGAAERTVARQLAHGACGIRVRDMFNVEPFYMDCWAAPAAQARKNGRNEIHEEGLSHAVEHTCHDDPHRPGSQEGGHGHPGRAQPVHVHRRQRVPQGARPGGRDAVRDEGQDAGARRGNGEIACGNVKFLSQIES